MASKFACVVTQWQDPWLAHVRYVERLFEQETSMHAHWHRYIAGNSYRTCKPMHEHVTKQHGVAGLQQLRDRINVTSNSLDTWFMVEIVDSEHIFVEQCGDVTNEMSMMWSLNTLLSLP